MEGGGGRGFKYTGAKNRQAKIRERRELRKIVLEAKVTIDRSD
jgi:hypothetical protein